MITVTRAFRFALDLNPAQEQSVSQHAGAARWAFNHALGMKVAAHREWRRQVEAVVASGVDEQVARKSVRVRIPRHPDIKKHLNRIKGSPATMLPPGQVGPERPCPWWGEVSTYAFQSAFDDCDRAWQNWMDSITGRRAGRVVGYPRFKRKGQCRDSFRLHHDVTRPTIRLDGYRRLILPRIGSVRLHDSGKQLARLVERGQAVVKSVTIARGGHRWYASVLCEVRQPAAVPTRRQKDAGIVGVDWGVSKLASLSTGEQVDNPRHLGRQLERLAKAQKALARTQRGSRGRVKAARRVGRLQHEIAEQRATTMHQLTKRLATGWSTVVIEDLNVAGMTRSAKGTVEQPGRNVRQKAGLNRSVLDAAPGEMRRQLSYKTSWYGSVLAVCGRFEATSKTCSACGWRNPSLTLAVRVFTCQQCGVVIDRDVNAALNIARTAVPLVEGDVKARGVAKIPRARTGTRDLATSKREGPAPPGHPG